MTFESIIYADEVKHLCRRLMVDPKRVSITSVSGGFSNRAFHFAYLNRNWMVRLPIKNQKQRVQALDTSEEGRLLKVIAEAGLTPSVVFNDEITGALVTAYLKDAVTWNSTMVGQSENLRRIAATLRSLHSVDVGFTLPLFKPTMVCERYFDLLRNSQENKNQKLNVEQKGWQADLRQLAVIYERSFPSITLCHHDLVSGNILDSKQLWLVDFEYAVQAHPILDIASLVALNGLNLHQRSLLLKFYFGEEVIPFNNSQLDEVIRLEQLISYFWALAQMNGSVKMPNVEGFADSMTTMLR